MPATTEATGTLILRRPQPIQDRADTIPAATFLAAGEVRALPTPPSTDVWTRSWTRQPDAHLGRLSSVKALTVLGLMSLEDVERLYRPSGTTSCAWPAVIDIQSLRVATLTTLVAPHRVDRRGWVVVGCSADNFQSSGRSRAPR